MIFRVLSEMVMAHLPSRRVSGGPPVIPSRALAHSLAQLGMQDSRAQNSKPRYSERHCSGDRIHDARHTCGTLMHLRGVPTAVISKWLGHATASFTVATYVHSQDDGLAAAGAMYATAIGQRLSSPSGVKQT
jgi:integrase